MFYSLEGRTDIFYYLEVRTDTICYTVHNCPEMEKYRVNKIHIGNFIDPIFFVLEYCTLCNEFIVILQPNLISKVFHIRTTNLSWFWIHTTMCLIFQFSMGYGICHGFVSIFHLWLHFFNMYMYETKWYNVNKEHNLIAVLHHEVSH